MIGLVEYLATAVVLAVIIARLLVFFTDR